MLNNVKMQRVTRWHSMFHVKHCFSQFFCEPRRRLRSSSHTAPTTRPLNARELDFHTTRARIGMLAGIVRSVGRVALGGGRKVRVQARARPRASVRASAPMYEAVAK